MSNLVWACATVMFKDEDAMRIVASSASLRVADFGTQELSNLTWGLATLGIFCEDWMEQSGAEMARRSRECVPQERRKHEKTGISPHFDSFHALFQVFQVMFI